MHGAPQRAIPRRRVGEGNSEVQWVLPVSIPSSTTLPIHPPFSRTTRSVHFSFGTVRFTHDTCAGNHRELSPDGGLGLEIERKRGSKRHSIDMVLFPSSSSTHPSPEPRGLCTSLLAWWEVLRIYARGTTESYPPTAGWGGQ